MSRSIDSDALTLVQRQLGLSGVGESATELESDTLMQVFDASSAIRRGRADLATRGFFYGILKTLEAGAGGSNAAFIGDAYNVGAAFALGTFPPNIDIARFDLWLLNVSGVITDGAFAANDECVLQIGMNARQQGFGKDSGVPAVVAATPPNTVARFTESIDDGFSDVLVTDQGEPSVQVNLRLIPGQALQMVTTSAAACDAQLSLMLGLFPVGMGQDVRG